MAANVRNIHHCPPFCPRHGHSGLLVLYEDLPAGASLVGSVDVLPEDLPQTGVELVKRIENLVLYAGVDVLVKLVDGRLDRPLVPGLPHAAGRDADVVVVGPLHQRRSRGAAPLGHRRHRRPPHRHRPHPLRHPRHLQHVHKTFQIVPSTGVT